MADLFGGNESEDMSSFLQILLNHSSTSAAATGTSPSGGAAACLFGAGGAPAVAAAESSSRINFSDYSSVFPKESDEFYPCNIVRNLDSSCEGSEASHEAPPNAVLPRSSKRSRAAEVHNLSEKRRRSRINEKLKALQNLIPNSNKTDKASMLDEAIEYLKHLQLQVQMLTMRNGLSLHPGYSLGSLQSMVVPQSGVNTDKENAILEVNRPSDTTLPAGEAMFLQSALEASNCASSSQLPTMGNTTNLGTLPGITQPMQHHYGWLNHSAPSKDVCRDDTLSRLQLDIGCSGNSSSPGVSS